MSRNRQYSAKRSFDETIEDQFQLVLLGLEGSGKSATGNSVLGKEEFDEKFDGTAVPSTFTTKDNGPFEIVDSPGFSDDTEQNESILDHCIKNFHHHAYLFVIRMTRAMILLPEIWKLFEQRKLFSKTIIVFTGEDDLRHAHTTTEQYIRTLPSNIEVWLNSCGARYVVIDNTGPKKKKAEKVTELKQLLKTLKPVTKESPHEQYTHVHSVERSKSYHEQKSPHQKPTSKPAKGICPGVSGEDYQMHEAEPNATEHSRHTHQEIVESKHPTHQRYDDDHHHSSSSPITCHSNQYGRDQPTLSLKFSSAVISSKNSDKCNAPMHQGKPSAPELAQPFQNKPPPHHEKSHVKHQNVTKEQKRVHLLVYIKEDDPQVGSLVDKATAIFEKAITKSKPH